MDILYGAINFILAQQMDFVRFGSCFPSFSLEGCSPAPARSRLAWCYGDLGVAMALLEAGKVVGELKWMEKGMEKER